MTDDTLPDALGASGIADEAFDAEPSALSDDTAPASGWLDAASTESADFIRTKGWGDLDSVVRSYRNLESMLGNDRAGRTVTLPKDEADTEALDALYDRLGRPEAPEGYAFDAADGKPMDEAALDWFRRTAHEAGLTARQATALFESWNEMASSRLVAHDRDRQAAQDEAIEALRDDWGVGFERKVAAAQRAAQRFGGKHMEVLEAALGQAALTEFLAGIGEAIGEDVLPVGEGSGGFGLSPEAARTGYEQRKRDPDFLAALQDAGHPGHAAASAERARFLAAIWPGR